MLEGRRRSHRPWRRPRRRWWGSLRGGEAEKAPKGGKEGEEESNQKRNVRNLSRVGRKREGRKKLTLGAVLGLGEVDAPVGGRGEAVLYVDPGVGGQGGHVGALGDHDGGGVELSGDGAGTLGVEAGAGAGPGVLPVELWENGVSFCLGARSCGFRGYRREYPLSFRRKNHGIRDAVRENAGACVQTDRSAKRSLVKEKAWNALCEGAAPTREVPAKKKRRVRRIEKAIFVGKIRGKGGREAPWSNLASKMACLKVVPRIWASLT